MFRKLQLGALVAALAFATGCASVTPEQLAEVRTIAENALSAANSASSSANSAQQAASAAQSTANQALSAANAAQACCDATNEKVDRMFEDIAAK
ncbi:MAG TPA: Lpp/OprI family alanine-zipper lipoprotein [Gammaproteobacteria bacterium]